ncbi:DUF5682 family protein [Streptomyces barkulensis]|uniref:DUF5682 family protein n=1 Tax=Streptomyces barkulensis TaxID=1257026 RepID=UPI003B8A8792
MSLSHGAAPVSPTAEGSPLPDTPAAPAPPGEVLAALTGPSAPYLVGVRHHAPSLAAAVPALLDAAEPEVLLVELPAEMQRWLPWLGHEETRAPVALAAVPADGSGGGGPAFYPFADFSPELAAVRWATRRGVEVIACDLPLADPAWAWGRRAGEGRTGGPRLAAALRARLTGRAGDDLWDRLVEATAPGSPPEALRRAALLTGWALREDAAASGGVPELDLRRERWMRARLAEATAHGQRAAVVVGAFHAPALVGQEAGQKHGGEAGVGEAGVGEAGTAAGAGLPAWTTSLIPYTYALLDERSGYPAGIRDPQWQDMVLHAAGDPAALTEALTRAAVRVCGELRSLGHPSGPADAREITRLASDLARLRGLPAAGRGELVEAVQAVLAQGEPYGRGRAVARAMERVLVGTRGGRPAPRAPRSGLAPATEAMLTAAGARGVTPAQAAEGVLRERRRLEREEGGPTAAQALEGLRQAAQCGLAGLADERLGEVADVLPRTGTLPELLAGLALLDRLRAGHVPGLGTESGREARAAAAAEPLTAAAVRQVDGLTGSEDPADARALLELSSRADLLGGIRLSGALARLSADGSHLMRGAAAAVRVLLGHEDARALGDRVASWVDGAADPGSRTALTARLGGLLTAAGPLLEAAPPALEPLLDRVTELPDRDFLDRLPALRGGFDTLSPAARDRLLAAVEERLGTTRVADTGGVDPAALAAWAEADLTARETLRSWGLPPGPDGAPAKDAREDAALGPAPGAPAAGGAAPPAAPSVPPAGDRLLAPAESRPATAVTARAGPPWAAVSSASAVDGPGRARTSPAVTGTAVPRRGSR